MKTKRTFTITTTERARPRIRTLASYLCFGVLVSILVASAFYTGSSASSNNKAANAADSASAVIRKDAATEKSFAPMWFA
ncbi:MAG TPA: hypothetical protein VJM12_22065, partial [Pyrinomonadaceae bacterium]|nr:hypothetical protein [Pyrinomonadaceae bacterium]